jgi:trimeric autotransporter adhesin
MNKDPRWLLLAAALASIVACSQPAGEGPKPPSQTPLADSYLAELSTNLSTGEPPALTAPQAAAIVAGARAAVSSAGLSSSGSGDLIALAMIDGARGAVAASGAPGGLVLAGTVSSAVKSLGAAGRGSALSAGTSLTKAIGAVAARGAAAAALLAGSNADARRIMAAAAVGAAVTALDEAAAIDQGNLQAALVEIVAGAGLVVGSDRDGLFSAVAAAAQAALSLAKGATVKAELAQAVAQSTVSAIDSLARAAGGPSANEAAFLLEAAAGAVAASAPGYTAGLAAAMGAALPAGSSIETSGLAAAVVNAGQVGTISLQASALSLCLRGTTWDIAASARRADGSSERFSVSSSDPAVVTASAYLDTKIEMLPLKHGRATLRVVSASGASAAVAVEVNQAEATASAESLVLAPGGSGSLTLQGSKADGSPDTISWSIDQTSFTVSAQSDASGSTVVLTIEARLADGSGPTPSGRYELYAATGSYFQYCPGAAPRPAYRYIPVVVSSSQTGVQPIAIH